MDGVELTSAVEALAEVLEAPRKKKKRARNLLLVSAFGQISAAGKPTQPERILPGDMLYIQRTDQPGAGIVSRAPTGRPYAAALEQLAAGKTQEIQAGLLMKRWQTDGTPCPTCDLNAVAGWIPADALFPSGDEEPLAHPNCKCELETRRGD